MQDHNQIEAFVVRNTDYYTARWQLSGGGTKMSFNWAAAIGQVIWFAYRKLYAPMLIGIAVYILYVAGWMYIDDRALFSPGLMTILEYSGAVALTVAFGFLGNSIYRRRYLKVKEQAQLRHGDLDEQLNYLRSKGGTSIAAFWILVVLFMLPFLWAGYWGIYVAGQLEDAGYNFDATGPLTVEEFEANFLMHLDEPLEGKHRDCVLREIKARAADAGDPETLDPSTVDFLPEDSWPDLDPEGRRIILMQVITTKAMFECPHFD